MHDEGRRIYQNWQVWKQTKQIELWDTNIQTKEILWVNTDYKELAKNCKMDLTKLQSRQQKDKHIGNVKEKLLECQKERIERNSSWEFSKTEGRGM